VKAGGKTWEREREYPPIQAAFYVCLAARLREAAVKEAFTLLPGKL
jgi:hypothetical protein